MSRYSRSRIGPQMVVFIMAGLLLMVLLVACGSSSSEPTQVPSSETVSPTAAPGLDGATLLETRCSVCHSADRATQVSKTAGEWEQTVNRMIGNGAQLNDAEKTVLVQYLAENYGP